VRWAICAAAVSSAFSPRPKIATAARSLANSSAAARPSPRPPPPTSATLSANPSSIPALTLALGSDASRPRAHTMGGPPSAARRLPIAIAVAGRWSLVFRVTDLASSGPTDVHPFTQFISDPAFTPSDAGATCSTSRARRRDSQSACRTRTCRTTPEPRGALTVHGEGSSTSSGTSEPVCEIRSAAKPTRFT
jgi:hypothetical protein